MKTRVMKMSRVRVMTDIGRAVSAKIVGKRGSTVQLPVPPLAVQWLCFNTHHHCNQHHYCP